MGNATSLSKKSRKTSNRFSRKCRTCRRNCYCRKQGRCYCKGKCACKRKTYKKYGKKRGKKRGKYRRFITQRGGSSQYGNNLAKTSGYSIPAPGMLRGSKSALANPPPIKSYNNCTKSSYNHYTRKRL